MAKIKKVQLNESKFGSRDVLYPQTSYEQIMIKNSIDTETTKRIFPEVSSEYIGQALILSSDGEVYVFGEAGKVDDVRLKWRPDHDESVVEHKIASISLSTGLTVDSNGNIIIDDSEFVTRSKFEEFKDFTNDRLLELSEGLVNLSDGLAAEIRRSTSEDEALRALLNSESDRLDREIARSMAEDSEMRLLLDSEIGRLEDKFDSEIGELDDRLTSEIMRARNSEAYIIDLLDAEIRRAKNSEGELRFLLTSEITRATNSERYILNLLSSEIYRATNSERQIINKLDAEILRATNSERFLLNKINDLDLPETFLIEAVTDSNGNLAYRIPRKIKQEDGQIIISSEGVTLGSAAALNIIQAFGDSESIAVMQRVLPTAEAVRAYVGNGRLHISIRKGGVLQSEGISYRANQDDNVNFEIAIPARFADLLDNSEYYNKHQVDNKLNGYLKKFDSEGILNTSEHYVLDAINEVLAFANVINNNKANKLTVLNAGNGINITLKANGQLDKISVKPNTLNNTIIVDSSGISGNYQAGTALELANRNKFNVLFDNDTIKVTSEGELYFAKTIEDLLPVMAGKRGKALVVDSSGHIAWGDAGKIDAVEIDGSESRIVTANKIATIQQIDASIIKGLVQGSYSALYDSAGNIFTTTYQRIDNMTAGITSEATKYPSDRAVYNALLLKQDKLSAGAAIDPTNLASNVVRVRYDGRSVMLNSENNLEARNVVLTFLNGKPYISQIIPTDTSVTNYLMNLDEVNDKLRDALGNYVGLFTSEGAIPRTGVFKNDYAYVTTKNSEGENFLSRYKCQQTSEGAPITWAAEYTISLGKDMLFTRRQAAALNSGINSYLVSEGITHFSRTDNPHNVTADQLGLGPFKNKTIQQVVSEGLTVNLIENKFGDTVITQTRGDARYKKIQTAVTDPTATTGTVISFIDSISQNTQGVITATKKTIPNVTNTQSGLMTPAMKLKLDDIADGATRVTKSNINGNIKINNSETTVYTLPIATTTRLGGVKIGNKINVAADGTISTDGTTYTFVGNQDGTFTVTPAGGSAQIVNVLPTAGSEGNGRYLRRNATTGDVEWGSAPSGGGGVSAEDGLLYIQVNGSNVTPTGGVFSANKSSNSTYDLTIPVPGTGLELGTASGRTNVFNHSNSVTAVTTIPTTSINNLKYDAQGHITGITSVTGDSTNGIEIVSSKIKHTNEVSANTTSGLKYFTYDVNGHVTAATNKTLNRGIDDQSNVIGHSNTAVTAVTTPALAAVAYDTYGHITSTTAKTLGRGISDSSNVIGHSNTAITANTTNSLKTFTYDTYGHVTAGTNKTLGRGINDSSNVIGHSNSVTAVTSEGFLKLKYDQYGHITGTTPVTAGDITPLVPSVTVSANRGLDVTSGYVGHSHSAISAGTLNNNSAVSSWATDQDIILSKASYNTYGHISAAPTDITYTIGQSDWDNNTTTSFAYIKNRPNIRLNGHTSSTGMDTTGTVIGNSTNVASGNYSLAEGSGTTASGTNSHAEGNGTTAAAIGAHVEGNGGSTNSSASYSHVEGISTSAIGVGAHAEGKYTTAGMNAHAEGGYTYAGTLYSHAEGDHTKTPSNVALAGVHVEGRYNNTSAVESLTLPVLISTTGIGDSEGSRANGMALTTTGDLRIKGKVYIGCNDDSTGGVEAGGSSHYGTCTLGPSTPGTVNITPVFADGYQLDGTEHPVLDIICTNAENAESELSTWGAVYKATANADHSITFYIRYETTVAVTVQVLV